MATQTTSRFVALCSVPALACLGAWSACGDELVMVAPVEAAVAAADAPADANRAENPQLAAIRSQFEPMLKIELSFASRVCQWTADERRAAIAAAKAWLREFAAEYAKNNGQVNQGFVVFLGNGPAGAADQNSLAETKLAEVVRGKMTDRQRANYNAERKKRDAFRAEATIENLVAQLDQRLELSAEQRQKLSDSLRTHWSDDWAPPLQLFVQMAEYIPAVPDEHILPHLSPEQQVAWRGVQKISARGIHFGGGIFGGGPEMIDDIDLNEAQ